MKFVLVSLVCRLTEPQVSEEEVLLSLDRDDPEPLQMKEELELKRDTWSPTYEEGDHGEPEPNQQLHIPRSRHQEDRSLSEQHPGPQAGKDVGTGAGLKDRLIIREAERFVV